MSSHRYEGTLDRSGRLFISDRFGFRSEPLRIVSRAPLGRQGEKPWVSFIAKDLGHWRDVPDYLEIKLSAPGSAETRLAGLEPNPARLNSGGIRWIYRKANPDRDTFVLLSSGYYGRSARR
jgi:hypothetical protein